MFKLSSLLAFILIPLSTFAQEPVVTFRQSKMVGVVRLIDSLASLGVASPALKIIHNRTLGRDRKSLELIARVQKEEIGRSQVDRMYTLAAASKSKEELKFLIYGLRKNRKADEKPYLAFLEAIDHFTPRYEKLARIAAKPIRQLLHHLRSKKMRRLTTELVRKTTRFYRAELPIKEIDIVIVPLVGLKPKEKLTRSQSLGPLQVVEVILPSEKFSHYGVVIHEIAHYCQAHSKPLERAFAHVKKVSKTHGGLLKQSIFNEALATAIGNGYAEKRAGLKWSKRWYENTVYDKYAKALYDKTKEYLLENKELDESFADHSLQTFKRLFPNIHKKPNTVFRSIFLATQGFESKGLALLLRSKFPIEEMDLSSPISHPFTKEGFLESANKTKIFLLPPRQLAVLKSFSGLEYEKVQTIAQSKESFLFVHWSDKWRSFFIVVVANKEKDGKRLMEKLFTKDKIDEGLYLASEND